MPVSLSASSYLILGLIGLRGPSSSYQLKRAVERSIGYFWPFPHSQLYGEPRRLTELGLLAESAESQGRRVRTYSLTEAGRDALHDWVSDPQAEMFQIRNEAELKLFFSELGETSTVHRLAQAQVDFHENRVIEFQKMLDRLVAFPQLEQRVAPLVLGVRLELACLSFWRDVLESGISDTLVHAAMESTAMATGQPSTPTDPTVSAKSAARKKADPPTAAKKTTPKTATSKTATPKTATTEKTAPKTTRRGKGAT